MRMLVPEEHMAEFEQWMRDRAEGWEVGGVTDTPLTLMREVLVADDPVIAAKIRTLQGRPCP